MKLKIILTVSIVAMFCSANLHGALLLDSINRTDSISLDGATSQALYFQLGAGTSTSFWPIGSISGTPWSVGQTGFRDYTSNDTNFSTLASYLTNGSDDYLWTHLWRSDLMRSITYKSTESTWGISGPDLAGAEIVFVRQVVNSISLSQNESLITGDVTWEFWGEPIPEPCTLLLLSLGGLLIRKRYC